MRHITSDPDIMGGSPVIQGTRVPIAVILSLVKQGYTVQEIHKMYNWISVRKLKGAVDEIADLVTTSLHAKSIL